MQALNGLDLNCARDVQMVFLLYLPVSWILGFSRIADTIKYPELSETESSLQVLCATNHLHVLRVSNKV